MELSTHQDAHGHEYSARKLGQAGKLLLEGAEKEERMARNPSSGSVKSVCQQNDGDNPWNKCARRSVLARPLVIEELRENTPKIKLARGYKQPGFSFQQYVKKKQKTD